MRMAMRRARMRMMTAVMTMVMMAMMIMMMVMTMMMKKPSESCESQNPALVPASKRPLSSACGQFFFGFGSF